MSVIGAIQTYFAKCSELDSAAPVWVNYLGDAEPLVYSIIPAAGTNIIDEYLSGTVVKEYLFAFQSMEYTIDEATRLATQEFFEDFAEWVRAQHNNENYPDLGTGKTVTEIEVLNWGVLVESSESQTGIYQINLRLEFDQRKE